MEKLTREQFSMQCAFIAKHAASWAADTLYPSASATAETVARFTDEMRERLDRLDEWAGRAAIQKESAGAAVPDEFKR